MIKNVTANVNNPVNVRNLDFCLLSVSLCYVSVYVRVLGFCYIRLAVNDSHCKQRLCP
jgi:hypothetical protein